MSREAKIHRCLRVGGGFTFYERKADRAEHFLFSRYSCDFFPSRNNPAVPTFHNSVEIIAVLSGEFEVMISGEWRRFGPGSLVYIDRMTPHLTRAAESVEDLCAYVLVISVSYLSHFREIEDMTFDTVLSGKVGCDEIFELIKWGYSRFSEMNTDMKAGFSTMLFGAMKKNFEMHARPEKKKYMLLIDIVEYINAHYAEPINLELLSRKFGYEKTYLSKIINRMLGMSFKEYLNNYRISMVKRLMAEHPDLPPIKICGQCGFESSNTFYRAYKKYK